MCEIYWEKSNTESAPSPFLGRTMFSPKFSNGITKNECLGELKESIPQIFVRGLLHFLSKKTGFEDSISNVDLSSAANQPFNVKACVCYFLSNFIFLPNDNPSKTLKNAFLFHLKSSFCSQDIQFFVTFSLPFWTFQIQKEKWKCNNLWCHELTCINLQM